MRLTMNQTLHPDYAERKAPYVWFVYDREDEVVATLDWRSIADRDGYYFSDHLENIAHMIAASSLMHDALKAVEAEGVDANKNGDLTIPSHVWDLISQALKAACGPERQDIGGTKR